MELELLWLLAPDLPSHRQVNLTQRLTKWQADLRCLYHKKNHHNQKVLVMQSSNIVYCNWHTQKPLCADFQAFSNTFSLLKLTFFNFLFREFSKQPKISHFVYFDWEKCIKMVLVVSIWSLRHTKSNGAGFESL